MRQFQNFPKIFQIEVCQAWRERYTVVQTAGTGGAAVMDAHSSPDTLLFGLFRFDRRGGLFRCTEDGRHLPVSIGARALAVFEALTERPGDLVTKDEIMSAAWPGTVVEEGNLTVQISTLRRVLDAGSEGGSCIQTLSGRGYRFVLPVTRPAGTQSDSALVHSTAVASAAEPDRRQSVIILPFKNSSGDAAQDGLAADMTHEVTDRISRGVDPIGLVIPEMTAAAYRGKEGDPAAIARHHDVHFALIGSASRRDGRLIVSAILYEAAGGQTVWARQFDRQDGCDTQQAIVQAIYESFWQASVDEEVKRAMRERPNDPDKRDLILMALTTRLGIPTKAHYQEKLTLIDRVLALDPNDLVGLERQARWRSEFVLMGYSSDPTADLTIAGQTADRMLMLDANSILSLRARAKVLQAQGSWREAEAVLLRVIDLQPTEANRRGELGQILMAQGRHQEALDSFRTAKRFAGGADPVYRYDAGIALAALAVGQFEEAIVAARLSISEFPPRTGRLGESPWLALIGAESGSGQNEAARTDLQKFLATPRNCRSMAGIEKWPEFAANPKLLDGLRHAGMPAE
jgi:DNA-binding winged helix-turn-helix (wHTH) protein/tetratricopeptide (TPR) repeat protein